MHTLSETDDPKAVLAARRLLRGPARARRRALDQEFGVEAADRALECLWESDWLVPGMTVAAYWPLPSEFDARPFLRELHFRGYRCVLPAVIASAEPLVFRVWRPGTELVMERFGVAAPPEDAEQCRPDLLLVPLLAFDAEGNRLGYGGGYYDRTLAVLRADGGPRPHAVGLCYAGQEVAEVPHGPQHQKLDALLTEAGTRSFPV